MKYLLTVCYLVLTISGMFLLKAGGDSLELSLSKGIMFKMNYITLFGFVCYLCSFLLWQKLLTTYDLSYIVPITTGISQIIILIVGVVGFKENVNFVNVGGVLLVGVGVFLIALGRQ